MIRILLTGEGPTDCGKMDYETQSWQDGPVQVYIRKIADEGNFDVEILTVDKGSIAEARTRKRQSAALKGLQGHAKKAFFVMQVAVENGCDVAAMYLDSDKNSGEQAPKTLAECRKRYNSLKNEVLSGLLAGGSGAQYAMAVIPVKMIECWILGDRGAFEKLFGEENVKANSGRRDFTSPELIWGKKDDLSSDYPKHKLERILSRYHAVCSRETFVQLAEESDIDVLRESCPVSFEDFYSQLVAACSANLPQ